MNFSFKDKHVLITGGTRGIGKAIAEEFQALDANVTITGTSANYQGGFAYKQLDLLDDQSMEGFVSWLSTQTIDVLINNAGINKVLENTETENSDFDMLLDVNLKGPYILCREVSKTMKSKGYGRIVNISSIWSTITRAKRSLYSASKFGLVGLTKTLAVELAEHNVLVNSVAPGFTLTELTKETNTAEELNNLAQIIPIKRLASPTEIANLVLFLSSDKNTYLTGQNVVIDGGYTIV